MRPVARIRATAEGDTGHDEATRQGRAHGRLLMFATLLGDLPRPPLPADAPAEAIVRAVVEAQVAAGLEPVTDGGWWGSLPPVTAWQRTSALTDRLVKQAMLGPYSTVETVPPRGRPGWRDRREAMTAAARSANTALLELAAAGCPFIEVHEPGVVSIGRDRTRGDGSGRRSWP